GARARGPQALGRAPLSRLARCLGRREVGRELLLGRLPRREEEAMIDDAGRKLVALALAEDLGDRGDVTGRIVPERVWAKGAIVARTPGTIAGMEIAEYVLREVEPRARLEVLLGDGAAAPQGALV